MTRKNSRSKRNTLGTIFSHLFLQSDQVVSVCCRKLLKKYFSDFGMAMQLPENAEYYEMSEQQKLPVRWLSPEASAR